ncbi:MAG TPA: N-6 DNA methylase, partial [Candidatus Acidoferrum sp.]|nr:N-6 DNA methylase [Candidatus Acidoferrum sp.]
MSSRIAPAEAFHTYLRKIQENLASGISSEDTHRSALEHLLESLDPTIRAFNDPKHISVGAPDFTVRRKGNATDFPVGWVETKDIGEDLNKAEKSEQLERYFGLPNLILTDYLQFRWFVDGKLRLKAQLATLGKGKRLRRDAEGEEQVAAILTEFLSYSLATLVTPQELAERMAKLAHLIRDVLLRTLQAEPTSGHLHNQFEAFRETLIPDLKPDQFADMYAQTIAYGLFAARCQSTSSSKEFGRAAAADLIPRTNPFLRRLFREIAFELDPRVQPFVDDLVALLHHAEIGKIMEDFGKRTAKEDPVVHFYEDFLQEYDPKIREMRGVYYTPEPVVSYIVRSVDHLLKTRFGKPMGLADKDVLILDPACGTGTFLYYVIRHINDALVTAGQKGQWNRYVSQNLLKRVFGFELLMAPYAVAHLKLGLLLQDLGYKFESDERLGIYLTNTLEEAIRRSEKIFAEWISEEANAASEIKRDKPIMVVLGNPPYSGHSANKGKWITELMEDYKRDCPELYKPAQAKWLQDDYVKFLRFAQWRIDLTGYGVLAFITNHGYVDNPTFRCMRQQLLRSFPKIHLLDLHGSSKKKEVAPDGSKDENVFDIQQGVAIGIFLKHPAEGDHRQVSHAELWGTRASKYKTLMTTSISDTQWRTVSAQEPLYLFVPRDEVLFSEYEKGWRVPHIFDRNGDPAPGVVTTQDEFAISFTAEEAKEKVHRLLATETEEEARSIFRL